MCGESLAGVFTEKADCCGGPFQCATLLADQIISALREATKQSEQPEPEHALKRAAETALQSAETAGEQGWPILWVDDHPTNNASIIRALADQFGIRVDIALATREALDLFRRQKYSLIISDLGREEEGENKPMAGLELIQAVRDTDRLTPIFIFAGFRAMEHKRQLEEAGANLVTSPDRSLSSYAMRR
jgi:CheY-like chemotaxis protein